VPPAQSAAWSTKPATQSAGGTRRPSWPRRPVPLGGLAPGDPAARGGLGSIEPTRCQRPGRTGHEQLGGPSTFLLTRTLWARNSGRSLFSAATDVTPECRRALFPLLRATNGPAGRTRGRFCLRREHPASWLPASPNRSANVQRHHGISSVRLVGGPRPPLGAPTNHRAGHRPRGPSSLCHFRSGPR
jgi:hypothetical protein